MTTQIPPEIEALMYSQETEDTLVNIANEEGLHVDQLGDLHDSVNMVFLGELHPDRFVPDIKRMLDLTEEKARIIAKKVDEQVFVPAREALKNAHSKINAVDELSQNFDAKDVLRAISNPTSIPTTSTVTQTAVKIEVPKPISSEPIVPKAPLPDMPQTAAPDADEIYIKKLSDVTVSPTKSIEQNISDKKPLIPNDHIERIASDPYKENVI